MVPPNEMISVAEQSGLIARVTEFVLREACGQIESWHKQGMTLPKVSINLSAVDFRRPDLVSTVSRILAETGTDPTCIELEITEGMVMGETETVVATMKELNTLGVELAIDDFGTGYSSMIYLKRFPLNRIKIDQAFIHDVLTSTEDAGITKAIIDMGHNLGLKVIAEGVESEEQLQFLRHNECDEAQGFWCGRPQSADEFSEFFREHTPTHRSTASKGI